MTKTNLSVSKEIKLELTADEVQKAILRAAHASKATEAEVAINVDGSASVTYKITK